MRGCDILQTAENHHHRFLVLCLDRKADPALNMLDQQPFPEPSVSMQRLSATIAVTPKGRIINSCTDYWTIFMLIIETQVSKLTLTHTPEQNSPSRTEQSGVVQIPNP